MTQTNSPIITPITPPISRSPSDGVLSGKTCAVKDNIDIEGLQTGGGNPSWALSHDVATSHAVALQPLLDAGLKLTAKTHLDELAFSLMGTNHHYGTPLNPRASDRVPGGSSSGSASAVASGLADIGIGTDTGGSVRMPASFCGLFGLRPTHGVISTLGVIPLAPSYDTVGFFARTLDEMSEVASLYFVADSKAADSELVAPSDIWALADTDVAETLMTHHSLDSKVNHRRSLFHSKDETDWSETFRVNQSYEAWRSLGSWIQQNNPNFGPGLKDRFEFASSVSSKDFENARQERARFVTMLESEIAENEIIIIPTGPGPAPYLTASSEEFGAFRKKAISFSCIAGHAGWPQLSIPGATVNGAPVGLSIIGRPGSEMELINQAKKMKDHRFG